jgi:hypothetical protein
MDLNAARHAEEPASIPVRAARREEEPTSIPVRAARPEEDPTSILVRAARHVAEPTSILVSAARREEDPTFILVRTARHEEDPTSIVYRALGQPDRRAENPTCGASDFLSPSATLRAHASGDHGESSAVTHQKPRIGHFRRSFHSLIVDS